MPNQNQLDLSQLAKRSEEYYLSFPDGSLSKALLEFAYIDEIKWTEETLSQNIAKKIYKFPKEIMPHYYQFSVSVEEYRRFRETELGLKAIDLWQNELLQCLSILKDWANTQDIKIFDEHRQLVSASNLLSRFFDRLKNDEFSDKTALFYADGKKAIEIIALLIQDENIDLAFRQNQLVALTTDGNLMHCADGCVARLMETAESLRNYAEFNLPGLIRKFILYLAQATLKNQIHGITQPYITYLCNEEGITVAGNEIHAQNYLINRLLSALGLGSLGKKDALTHLFKKATIDEIYFHYEMEFKKNFCANRLIEFIKETYYQQKDIHFSEATFYSTEDFDIGGLSYFLDGLGQDDAFNLNEVLKYDDNTQKTTLKDAHVLSITLAERLLNAKWFDLSETSRWVAKYKLLAYFTQHAAYTPQTSDENVNFRIFTGNLALSWLKREEKETRETLLTLLSSENNPIDILQKIPINRLDYLLENSDDLILFFKTLPTQEHIKAIHWLRNRDFDLRAALLNKFFFIRQLSLTESKIFFEQLILLKDFNYLFSDLIKKGLSEFLLCCNTRQLIEDVLAESTMLTRFTSQRFFSAYTEFIKTILKAGFRQFKELTFQNPQSYLRDIDFSDTQFESIIFKTPIQDLNFKNAVFNRVAFFYDLYRLSFESSKGTIEIVGSERPLIIKDVDFILTELEMFVTKATLKNTDFSYSTGKIGIQGNIVDSFLINFKGIFSLSGNIKNTLLDYFSGTLRVNGNVDTCYFRHMNFKKIIINGKISASSFSGTDFRNTHFYKEINLNDIAESKKNIFSGKFYFSQEDKGFLYFLNSKFSTLSFTQFLNYPGMEEHYQSCYLLRGTDLREVNFQDFELQQVLKKYFLLDLSGANLEGVKFDYFSQDVSNTHYINLLDANLKDASFRYANLQHFDFTESDLSNCDFSLTNLVSANVRDTKIENIKLRIDQLFQFYDQDHIDFSSLRLVGSLESQWQDQSLEGAKLSSQAFQYLIQQGFRNFALTDLSGISNDILLQYYSRIDLDFEFARLPTDFGFNRCLENKHRKRRELCLFGWDEVDQFNEEKMDSRNLNKILIRSESFLTTFMSASMAQQEQLLEFAKHYPIIGSETHKIQHLLQFSRWQSNLNKLNHVSLLALKGLMTKDLAISILNGAYDDTAINLGLLSAGKLLSKFSNEIKVYEKALQLNGKKLLSKVFKISAPFTAHATIAYLVYDLIQAVKQLDKENANNFLLRIIDDGIYLSIDATEIAIKMTELFEIAEISFLIEPVTLVLELVVFLGSDIYQAVEFVQQINNIVPLTAEEKFYVGLRAFFGFGVGEDREELLEEKQMNNQLAREGLSYLKKHDTIRYYIFPTAKRVEDCWFVPYLGRMSSGGGFGGGKGISSPLIKWDRYCNSTFPVDLNNKILLDKKIKYINWMRDQPEVPEGGELFCFMPACRFKSDEAWNNETYYCKDAIGIRDRTPKVGNYTLINVGAGEDEVHGFRHYPNIIVARNGHKNLRGGNLDDMFILQEDLITGSINGLLGSNTLELNEFSLQNDLKIDLQAKVLALHNNTKYMNIVNIQQVLGRSAKKERIICVCDTHYIDGRGGAGDNNTRDVIIIPNFACAYQLTLKVPRYTSLFNQASNGNFSYLVRGGEALLYLNSTANHQISFNYTLAELQQIQLFIDPSKLFIEANFYFNTIELKQNDTISLVWLNQAHLTFSLRDQIELKFSQQKIYILQKSQQTLQEIIQCYPEIASRLKAILIVRTHNECVVIGSSHHDVLQNDPYYATHLLGNGGSNIYKIIAREGTDFIPTVTLYDSSSTELKIETLDLRDLFVDFKKRMHCLVILVVEKQLNHLQLSVYPDSECQFKKRILEIILNDAITTHWYQRLNIIMNRSFLEIKPTKNNEIWTLLPKPLKFNKFTRIMVISKHDVESHTTIVMPKAVKSLTYVRSGNNFTDLIFFTGINETFYGLILKEFYLESHLPDQTLRSLSIQYYVNKQMSLESIAIRPLERVPTVNQLQNSIRDKVYQSVLNAHSRTQRSALKPDFLEWNEPVASNSAKPSFWIFDILKQAYGLFSKSKVSFKEKLNLKQANQFHYFRLNGGHYYVDTQKAYRDSTDAIPQIIVVYKPKLKSIIITCSRFALLKGSVSAIFEEVSERYKKHCYYLSPLVRYGIKPSLLASSIDFGNPVQLLTYLMTHYIALQYTQTIEQKLTTRIQNKFIRFLIPLFLTLCIFHSYLFIEDDGVERFVSELGSHLMQSLLFKTGEWATKQTISQFFKKAPEVNIQPLNEPTQHLINSNRKLN